MYLRITLFSDISLHSTRQTDGRKFFINKTCRACDKLKFAYAAVLNLNNLPNNETATMNFSMFHKLLMSHIVSQLA